MSKEGLRGVLNARTRYEFCVPRRQGPLMNIGVVLLALLALASIGIFLFL